MQGAYYTAVFVQPLDFKNHWDSVAHVPYVVPIETAWSFVALVVYLVLAWRTHARYQHWLDTALSNREEYRLDWPRRFLIACSVTVAIWVSQTAYEAAVGGFTYFDRLPLYLWFSLLVYGLGLGGLRSAGLTYPRPDGLAEPAPQLVLTAPTEAAANLPIAERQTDWREMGQRVDAEVRAGGWWRDPDLTAPKLARLLATNTTYLSRALNEGLGVNFNEFINRIRVEAVQAELRAEDADRDRTGAAGPRDGQQHAGRVSLHVDTGHGGGAQAQGVPRAGGHGVGVPARVRIGYARRSMSPERLHDARMSVPTERGVCEMR